jgi:hypothetical protein
MRTTLFRNGDYMKNKNRFVLFLLLSAFSTMFCRCTFDNGVPVTLNLSDGNTLECREFYETEMNWSATWYFYSYDCSIPCPDGSEVPAKEMRLPNIEGQYNGVDIVDLDLATLQEQYCTPTIVPTDVPTNTPTPTASDGNVQITSAPFLTGRVTACDYKAGFVNFELADPLREMDDLQVQIALNDKQTKCAVPNNNADIFSCNLPAGIRFPINVEVEVDGTEVNDFYFDSSFCNYKESGGTGGNSGESGDVPGGGGGAPSEPTVVPTPTDFGG